jgi:uncharacterized protein (DUF302 family)
MAMAGEPNPSSPWRGEDAASPLHRGESFFGEVAPTFLPGGFLMTTFGIRKSLRASYDEALSRVPEALKAEGFGVLTEIDIKSTLERKLGVAFRRYKILGACNPPFAYEALQTDLEAGLVMPCNVVIYEDDEQHAVVMVADPTKTVAATGEPKLAALAESLKERLMRGLARLP